VSCCCCCCCVRCCCCLLNHQRDHYQRQPSRLRHPSQLEMGQRFRERRRPQHAPLSCPDGAQRQQAMRPPPHVRRLLSAPYRHPRCSSMPHIPAHCRRQRRCSRLVSRRQLQHLQPRTRQARSCGRLAGASAWWAEAQRRAQQHCTHNLNPPLRIWGPSHSRNQRQLQRHCLPRLQLQLPAPAGLAWPRQPGVLRCPSQ